jgi:exodeoxyribonuclease VII small subunit
MDNDEKYKEMKFEEAMKELERIVDELEKGDASLEESMELFSNGILLSKICSQKIDEIEKKITVLIEDSNGKITEEELDSEDDRL